MPSMSGERGARSPPCVTVVPGRARPIAVVAGVPSPSGSSPLPGGRPRPDLRFDLDSYSGAARIPARRATNLRFKFNFRVWDAETPRDRRRGAISPPLTPPAPRTPRRSSPPRAAATLPGPSPHPAPRLSPRLTASRPPPRAARAKEMPPQITTWDDALTDVALASPRHETRSLVSIRRLHIRRDRDFAPGTRKPARTRRVGRDGGACPKKRLRRRARGVARRRKRTGGKHREKAPAESRRRTGGGDYPD